MAEKETLVGVITLFLDAPLNFKPRPQGNQSYEEMLAAMSRAFFSGLSDIDDELLKAAAVHYITSSSIFPTIADIRQTAVALIDRIDEVPDAYTAWSEIMLHLRGGKAPSPLAAMSMKTIGGMDEFRRSDVRDSTSWRARFIDAYQVLAARRSNDAILLPAVASYVEKRKALGGQSISGLITNLAQEKSI